MYISKTMSNIPLTQNVGKIINPNGLVPRDSAYDSVWSGHYAPSIPAVSPVSPDSKSAGSSNGLNVYYTSLLRNGTIQFGSNSRPSPFDIGGQYTVSELVNDTNYVTLDTTPASGYFVVSATGKYLVDFSVSARITIPESNLELKFVKKSSGSPFFGGTQTPLCSFQAPSGFGNFYSGSLAGRAIISLTAGETFGVTIGGTSSGAETYVSGGVLTVKPLFSL
jgi:hypothetical protein